MAKYEPKEQTVVKPGDVVELNSGLLNWTGTSQDNNVRHIIHYMAMIWKNRAFPNGYIYSCRPYIDRMESKPQRYVLVVRTPNNRALAIDWGKAEWTVNIVGKPQLKIKGVLIGDGNTWGYHMGWDIMFYVDVMDIVKPEGKRPESVTIDESYTNPLWPKDNPALKYIDTDIALTRAMHRIAKDSTYGLLSENDTYKIGGNTMNKYELENGISRPPYEKYYGIRRNLRPSPKKVIYNGPATIVIFEDGSKTVVKLQDGEQMDREKAVYAAICKRMFGSNKNRSNWLDMLKPLMKEADEAWRVKSEALHSKKLIETYSGCFEFDCYEDALEFLNLYDGLYDKYLKNEKAVANILGYPGVTALRKAVKAAREVAKDGEES